MAEPLEHTFPSEEGTPEEEFHYLVGEGSDLLQAGRLDDAKRELARALAMRPGHEQAKNLLGLTLFRLGDLDPAQEIFEELVHENPVEPSLRLNLAMVHLKAGRLQDAREELERALDLNPDHKRAASYMAMVCERLGHFGDAADWYARSGNAEQAAAMRVRQDEAMEEAPAVASDDDDVPVPPAVLSGEGVAEADLMPDPLAVVPPADGEVQAAALSALRAEAHSRPPLPPSSGEAVAAREASREFTLDVDDAPEPPPLATDAVDDDGFIDPFADDDDDEPVETTKPWGTSPHVTTSTDASMKDLASPTRPAAVVDIKPLEVSPDDVELTETEPVEPTLPYAAIPQPPPGRASLRDDDVEVEATASPPPAADESVPDGVAHDEAGSSAPSMKDSLEDDNAEAMPAPPDVMASPPLRAELPVPAAAHAPSAVAEGSLGVAAASAGHSPAGALSVAMDAPSSSTSGRDPAPSRRELPTLTVASLGARGAADTATSPFVDDDGLLVFPIREAAYLRTDLLVGLRGSFEVEPVYRRYRGRRTDSFFGGSKTPLAAALGDGRAWLDAGDAEVTVLALDNEELYLVEGTLLAFSAGLVWENGRLPEPGGKDLDIVHLRGTGRVVLQTKRRLRAIESGDRPVTVAAPRLVGWAGAVVPSRGSFPGLPESVDRPSIVRFEGNGRVLVV